MKLARVLIFTALAFAQILMAVENASAQWPNACFDGGTLENDHYYPSFNTTQALYAHNVINTFYSQQSACYGPGLLKASMAVAYTIQGAQIINLCFALGDLVCPQAFPSNIFTFLYYQNGQLIPWNATGTSGQSLREEMLAQEIADYMYTPDSPTCLAFLQQHPWMN